ncbi:Ecotropic viral integration site 5 like protein [Choanephora cucurbitarum]|uniref:Ecotropic viral integration site 5 like protein n=1 Tax=Choanephora cucurbitarum TaxID=101091 RepID=A0A1C7NQU5_9FUNG|nr:Ecotropic viral integration site 5 like protein [Choanephora cucurbitarum]
MYNDDTLLSESCVTSKEDETMHFSLLPDNPRSSRSSLTTVETSSTTNTKSLYGSTKEENQTLFDRLKEENAKLPPQDSTAFILALVERQNVLLERDPKSIYIHSNKLKANFSTVQKLVHGNMDEIEEDIDWGFWEAVIEDSDQVALKLPHLLSLKLKSGIPSKVRGLIWQAMSKSASLHLETVYKQLCSERSPHERIIQRDLSRTFPRIDMFKQEDGHGQNAMKRILEAYSLYDTEVGYCQGLAFLVGPLLMNVVYYCSLKITS